MRLNIQDRFNKELPADPNKNNTRRQVHEACYSFVQPSKPSKPELIHVSQEMLKELGLTKQDALANAFLEVFSGTKVMENTNPYAMCYGGHQFGHWAGQLGDGRAINLAEVNHKNKYWTLQLKGAGPTPYSRGADGYAVLRSSIREHLCSEAMFHLGVPTTRSLSLMLSGDEVLRDMMYDGNAGYEKGAIVCRVAPSFLRFGNFQIFAARKDFVNLKRITEYTIQHHFPEIKSNGKESYIEFFRKVLDKSLRMVIDWQRVGFVHGVMNTDNMSILGLTIDYGPYGWLEPFDNNWTPNTTDRTNRRYRFGNQPSVVLWNLYQLANALHPIIEDTAALESILHEFQQKFENQFLDMMTNKLGLEKKMEEDSKLIENLFSNFEKAETDYTIFFRLLSNIEKNDTKEVSFTKIQDSFYNPSEMSDELKGAWKDWLQKYLNRINEEILDDISRAEKMNKTNPKYVLRNYMAQLAIDAAETNDFSIVEELHNLLKQPYAEQPKFEKWFAKRPEWARTKVGCSMLSCSS